MDLYVKAFSFVIVRSVNLICFLTEFAFIIWIRYGICKVLVFVSSW